jgi:hypothetical protein
MLPEWTVVGFSGHRTLPDAKVAAEGIHHALEQLAASRRPLAAVSSAASGADTLFMEEIAKRDMPHLVILPFAQSRFQQDFSPADWQRVLPLIAKATRVTEVTGEDSNDAAYMETGLRTADRADVMIVVWDGKPSKGLGGTGDVVNYVRAVDKPLLIVDPKTGQVTAERLEQTEGNPLPGDWKKNPRETVEKHYKELDETAQLHAPKSRSLVLSIILCQLAAAAVGFFAPVLGIHGLAEKFLMAAELSLLGVAFYYSLQQRKKHQEWVANRIAAEICRSFLTTWHMRWADHSPKLSIQGFDRLCKNLRLMQIIDQAPPLPLDDVCQRYLAERVQGQIKYFKDKGGLAQTVYGRLKILALVSATVAPLLSLLAFLLMMLPSIRGDLAIPELALPILKYFSLFFPLASAAIFSLTITQDHSRRAIRYKEMASILEAMEKRLVPPMTWSSLARIAAETEETLLQEIVEWHSFRKFVGEPH